MSFFIFVRFSAVCLHNFFFNTRIKNLKKRKKRHTRRPNFLIKLQIVMDWGNMKLFSYYFTVVSSAIFPQGIMAQQVDSSCLLLLLLLRASGSSIVFFQGYLSKELCNEKKNEIRCTSKKIVMIAIDKTHPLNSCGVGFLSFLPICVRV